MLDSTPEFTSFGVMLRHLRRKARLTQRELGTAVGYSEAHIARLEANQRRPDVAAITGRFIEALDLSEPEVIEHFVSLASATRKRGSASTATENDLLSEAPPTNLREQLTAFIGRDDELSEMKRILRTARLVSITGPGGVGKSRFAAHVASEMLSVFGDGVWIVSFANMRTKEEVLTAVAATMNLASDDLLSGLKNYLKSRKALLVLDNCEHVITACAHLAVTLLQVCPNLVIVVTSREPLSVPGEVSWQLPPMTCDEMHDLFVARARTTRQDFEANDENEPLLMQICNELEGNALAIELAASRLQVLSLQEIVDLLSDRFRLLTGDNRLAHPRHQSLRASLDWGFALLNKEEKRVFAQLSRFGEDWTLEDVEKLVAGEQLVAHTDALDLLMQLVKKSWVQIDDHATPARFSMSRTVREYALERAQELGA